MQVVRAAANKPRRQQSKATMRGRSPGSLRSLEAIRARRIHQGRQLRALIAELLERTRDRQVGAKEILWMLREAGPAARLHMDEFGPPSLRTVQWHILQLRRQRCA